MRKIRMLLVAAVAAAPLAPVAAQASHPDCAEETCPPADHCTGFYCPLLTCRVDPPVELSHDAIHFHERPVLDCDPV